MDAQLDIAIKFAAGKERLREAEFRHLLAFLKPDFPRPNCQTGGDSTYLQQKASQILHKTVDVESYQQWCGEHPSEVGSTLR